MIQPAGGARCLVQAITDGERLVGDLDALLPDRFVGQPEEHLTQQALGPYRGLHASAWSTVGRRRP